MSDKLDQLFKLNGIDGITVLYAGDNTLIIQHYGNVVCLVRGTKDVFVVKEVTDNINDTIKIIKKLI